MTIKIDGTIYAAQELPIGPNLAKYDARAFALEGPRGAAYLLTQSVKGWWHMMAVRSGIRTSYPLNVEIAGETK